MRTLPHIAIACGTVWAGARLLRTRDRQKTAVVLPQYARPTPGDGIDYRLVAVGSVLPDMVDRVLRTALAKPNVGRYSHLAGHTLLLNLPLLVAGARTARRSGDGRVLALGVAALTHLLVDPVVRSPRNLFWPLLGTRFPEVRGLSQKLTLISQAAAAVAAATVIVGLARRGRLYDFLTEGRL